MKWSDFYVKNKGAFIGPNGGKAYRRSFSSTDMEIYPGIFASDPEYPKFLTELSSELNTQLPKSEVDKGFFIGPPIKTDFMELKTQPGSLRPLSYGTSYAVTDENAINTERDFDAALDEVMSLRYSQTTGSPGKISSKSSSGSPLFLQGSRFKLEQLFLAAEKAKQLIAAVCHDDLISAYKLAGLVFMSTAQIRRQNDIWIDGAPKPREYRSLIQSLEQAEVKPFTRDILLQPNGLATSRTRVVFAYSSLANNIMTSVVDGYRDYADTTFAFTYKHRDWQDILIKLRKFKFVIGLDVKQFDNNVCYTMYRRWIERFPFSEAGRKLAVRTALSVHTNTHDKIATGDFLDPTTHDKWFGLPSGIFNTSAVGKDIMTATIYSAIKKVRKDITLESFLSGNGDIAMLNMGDDTVLMSNELSLLDEVVAAIDTFEVEIEAGFSFLGHLGYIDDSGDIQLAPNLSSYFQGSYIPEKGIDHKLRPYPMLGLRLRRDIYSRHPLFRYAMKIEKDLVAKYFSVNPFTLEEQYMRYPDITNIKVISSADVEVLTSFDKLFYKYDKDDVSPEIYNLVASDIPNKISDVFTKLLIERN